MQKLASDFVSNWHLDSGHILVYNNLTKFGYEETITEVQWLIRLSIQGTDILTEVDITDLPDEYLDPYGQAHFMCGCGHYVTYGQKLGQRFDCCPNCWLIGKVKGTISIPRPDRLTPELTAKLPLREVT
jgi:hypothetical protein